MKIAKISVFAQAYYSRATYEETIFADYEAVKHLDGEEMSVRELDGKHSDVYGEISVDLVSDDYFENNVAPENDADYLYWHITEGLEIDESVIIEPTFGKIKRQISCTPDQWELIQSILGGN